LPTYVGEPDDPINAADLNGKYPLIFTDEHSDYPNHHSWMRSVTWLREIRKDPYVKINPITAEKYGVSHGDWIELESPHGRMKAVAWLFEGLRPDTIMGHHGWWEGCNELDLPEYPALDGGVNPNTLYHWEQRDPITGDITKNTLVRIRKSAPPETTGPIQEVI